MLYEIGELERFATDLLSAAGCDGDKAETVARLLVTGDAMGHTTHGLAQLADYLDELDTGAMRATGEPVVVSDRGAAIVWDGERLPGVWLTAKAMDVACARADEHGLCAIAIRRSHHIACLAAFLPIATDRGLMAIIATSDPSAAMVAPHRGRRAVFTPDPIAVGIPTDGDPILIDMSTSITTAALSAKLRREDKRFAGPWAIDASGHATDDPRALVGDRPGALLPIGGLDHGHKGYGLALMVEALTQGLSAYGRADNETRWGASVFVQVINPSSFGGRDAFERQTGWIARDCRETPSIDPASPVRLPGVNALAGVRRARKEGLELGTGILDGFRRHATKFSLSMPQEKRA